MKSKQLPFKLTPDEKLRLETIAPFFKLEVEKDFEEKVIGIKSTEPAAPLFVEITGENGHYRLMSEICDRALRWIPFKRTMSAKESLLLQPDSKLKRIGELYDRWLSQGSPK